MRMIKFTIQRDGMITTVELDETSRQPGARPRARRALLTTRQLPPLPAAYHANQTLTVHLTFEYMR